MKFHPTFLFCIMQSVKWFLILILFFVIMNFFPLPFLKPILGFTSILVCFISFYKFLLFRSISYVLEGGQIKYSFGVLSKKTEYLELFRVRDLTKKQGLLDQIISTMTVEILSSDKSHPEFEIRGIPNTEIVDTIRKQVLISRKDNRIFEI